MIFLPPLNANQYMYKVFVNDKPIVLTTIVSKETDFKNYLLKSVKIGKVIKDLNKSSIKEVRLIGKNEDELGPRFPDMSEPYSLELIELAEKIALENQIKVQKGVYVAVPGPNLETKAEYRFLRDTGADVVGMSTIPENIVANHMGMKVLGISIITDECFPDSLKPVNVEEIIATAMQAEPKMTLIMKELIKRLK